MSVTYVRICISGWQGLYSWKRSVVQSMASTILSGIPCDLTLIVYDILKPVEGVRVGLRTSPDLYQTMTRIIAI